MYEEYVSTRFLDLLDPPFLAAPFADFFDGVLAIFTEAGRDDNEQRERGEFQEYDECEKLNCLM